MADFVSIANLAAAKLGEDDQLAAPEDDTHLSRSVKAVWDLTRRAALRDHSWNFAMQRARLPAEVLAVPPVGWAHSYRLPADCVRLIELIDRRRDDYQVEGKSILSDAAAPIGIRYIADVEQPALWDDLFVEAFACRLAFQIADRITGDRGRKSDAWNAYRAALAEAKRVDARENPQVPYPASSWETARWSGSEPTRYAPWGDPVT